MRQINPMLAFSDRLYRRFLQAYPAEYRSDFSDEMSQVFRDLCREIYEREGLMGFLGLWLSTLLDLLKTAIEERSKELVEMTKEKYVRLSGWALMLAGVTFIAGFMLGGGETSYNDPLGGPDAFYEFGQLIMVPSAMALFTLGMLGMRSRYGAQVGSFGNISLLIAAMGSGTGLVGSILLYAAQVDSGWIIWSIGMILLLLGLILFGISALRAKPLPRWNALPLITGSLLLIFPIAGMITGTSQLSVPVLATMFTLIGAGFIALGYVVQADAVEELNAA